MASCCRGWQSSFVFDACHIALYDALRYSLTQDVDRAPSSMMLFGNGDGGGGATLAMLQQLQRVQDVEGMPLVRQSTPDAFFAELAAHHAARPLCVWQGELYLELHQVRECGESAMTRWRLC